MSFNCTLIGTARSFNLGFFKHICENNYGKPNSHILIYIISNIYNFFIYKKDNYNNSHNYEETLEPPQSSSGIISKNIQNDGGVTKKIKILRKYNSNYLKFGFI